MKGYFIDISLNLNYLFDFDYSIFNNIYFIEISTQKISKYIDIGAILFIYFIRKTLTFVSRIICNFLFKIFYNLNKYIFTNQTRVLNIYYRKCLPINMVIISYHIK